MRNISTDIPIKPCPFCGEEAKLYRDKLFVVKCTGFGCGALQRSASIEHAIEKWNRRYDSKHTSDYIEVLDAWHYICPKCRKVVNSFSPDKRDRCPRCGF